MFSTFDSAEVPIPPVFDYHDERWWAYVHMSLFRVYFHVVIEFEDEEGDGHRKTVMYDDVSQLLATAKESDITLIEVQAVVPSHMSQDNRWSMMPLAEILVGYEPDIDHRQAATIYVFADGKRIVDSGINTSEVDLVDLASVIRFSS